MHSSCGTVPRKQLLSQGLSFPALLGYKYGLVTDSHRKKVREDAE
jgi:hypothetical protein